MGDQQSSNGGSDRSWTVQEPACRAVHIGQRGVASDPFDRADLAATLEDWVAGALELGEDQHLAVGREFAGRHTAGDTRTDDDGVVRPGHRSIRRDRASSPPFDVGAQ